MDIIVLICTCRSSRNKARTRHFNRPRGHWWRVRCGSQKRALGLWAVVREVCILGRAWTQQTEEWLPIFIRDTVALHLEAGTTQSADASAASGHREHRGLVPLTSGRCPGPWGPPQVSPLQCLGIWAYLAHICLFQCGSFGSGLTSFYSWLPEDAAC